MAWYSLNRCSDVFLAAMAPVESTRRETRDEKKRIVTDLHELGGLKRLKKLANWPVGKYRDGGCWRLFEAMGGSGAVVVKLRWPLILEGRINYISLEMQSFLSRGETSEIT